MAENVARHIQHLRLANAIGWICPSSSLCVNVADIAVIEASFFQWTSYFGKAFDESSAAVDFELLEFWLDLFTCVQLGKLLFWTIRLANSQLSNRVL
ncbi:hypothetical protein Pelo_1462 [Pelomyxa schiedti]|nr:hypothetical protein Pelo_1462 [Pelomyxa schiedti]